MVNYVANINSKKKKLINSASFVNISITNYSAGSTLDSFLENTTKCMAAKTNET